MRWLLIIPYAFLGYGSRGLYGLFGSVLLFVFVFLEVEDESTKDKERWKTFFIDALYFLILFGPLVFIK